MKTEETLTALPPEDDNSVTLDTPIIRGKTLIDSITLRKPQAGELRGVHLVELLNMDVATLIKILPRISNPSITAPEAAGMDPADLLACGSKISGFLLQKSVKADASLVA
ncbi:MULTISPECIES: phage tail assembly protein [Pseudomonas]|uniref:Phage tail protein n=1 Tax=Pseudomonas fluorescens TaxID=294 RepID=A0A0N9WUT9_PSEFL|nr:MULTISPECIES: phage tail assembly protein [Pseudomonas]ALI09105.1 phage tail protein [Pseudomonas fluorescens]SFL31663.1 Phage tail assembly chaperone protein, E, or 41 or 14 [Pseudomonas sp. NFACC46-3]SFY12056.1 Phage tail assembly chaperone protein, E, or 41 or 14 [Pseudomonas sp. NFACC36]